MFEEEDCSSKSGAAKMALFGQQNWGSHSVICVYIETIKVSRGHTYITIYYSRL